MYRNNQTSNSIKATAGDAVHQTVAIYYYRQGIKPSEAIDILKASNYMVAVKGVQYHVQGSSIANILTGLTIAHPSAKTKLAVIDNGTSTMVPNIEEVA